MTEQNSTEKSNNEGSEISLEDSKYQNPSVNPETQGAVPNQPSQADEKKMKEVREKIGVR